VAIFVINEWLPEDSSGVNGGGRQREAFSVISALAVSDHRIVIIEKSPFEQKFWNLCKSNRDVVVRTIVRAYLLGLRQNSDRCQILKQEEAAPIPVELATATKADDHYLLHAQLTIQGAILVTTDLPLRQAVAQIQGLPCLSREEFLSTYF
jgi:hypothetical protein